jgi:two-component system, OmpR family, response regulator
MIPRLLEGPEMMSSKKVLLVDDEAEFREITASFLKRRKIACETAGGCMEALDWIGRDNFSVVVMDVVMPGMDGLKCMAEMKKLQPNLAIIILTGNASLNTGVMSLKQGAFDFLMKPVDLEELLEKIILAGEKSGSAIDK